MLQHYFLSFTFVATFFLAATPLLAQEEPFPWPEEELGDPLIIEPGAPGTINATINGDTLENGERAHQVYILRRGATYLYTGRVNNVGHPLMVMAEEGDGPLPLIKALGPPPGEDEAPRAFHAQGDLYLKDLHINGRDQSETPTDNATVRLASDSITVVMRGILFDYNRQNSIRINGVGCTIYAEDCVIGPQGNSFNITQGFALSYRDNFTPLVHMRNCSFFSLSKGMLLNFGTARYGTLIMEHCTMVNSGIDGATFGRPDTLIFTDNLLVNTGILGDGFEGDRSNFAEPLFAYSLDSNVVAGDTTFTGNDTIVDFTYVPPYVEFERNHFYNRPVIAATLPDTSTSYIAGEILIDEELSEDMMGGANVMAQENFDFENFTMVDADFVAFIDDYYQLAFDQAEIPGYANPITEIDLSYEATHPAATAGRGGQPVGALNWWGLEIISKVYDIKPLEVMMSPNPTVGLLNVSLENLRSVVVYDINGRLVKLYNNLNTDIFPIQMDELTNGVYIVVAINADRQGVSRKVVKQ